MTLTALSCRTCGTEIEKGSRGKAPTYCSIKCKRRDQRSTLERTLTCATCEQPFTTRRADAKYCTPACRNPNAKRCSEDGCERPVLAKGLCSRDWKRRYGKRPKTMMPCTVCSTEAEKDADTQRRSVCSSPCRAYLEYGIWPRCDIPKRHAARGYVPLQQRPRPAPTQRPCLWCGTAFTTSRTRALYCTETCSAKAKRMRRRGREFEAGGTYTWSEVIALFLLFDRCCAYCRQEIAGQPEPDHVVALSRGGSNSITNILPSCSLCNSDKRDLLLHEWALDRERRHLPPRITEWRRGDPLYTHLSLIQEHEREHAA